MKVLLDTSVIIPALVEAHPNHARALPWLQRVRSGRVDGVVAAHAVAETYSVLTTLPHRPRITPAIAQQAIRENLLSALRVRALTARDYEVIVQRLSKADLSGGIIYDALAARAAEKSRVDRLVTFNGSDFDRLAGHFEITVELA